MWGPGTIGAPCRVAVLKISITFSNATRLSAVPCRVAGHHFTWRISNASVDHKIRSMHSYLNHAVRCHLWPSGGNGWYAFGCRLLSSYSARENIVQLLRPHTSATGASMRSYHLLITMDDDFHLPRARINTSNVGGILPGLSVPKLGRPTSLQLQSNHSR